MRFEVKTPFRAALILISVFLLWTPGVSWAKTLTVTDLLGRAVVVPADPKRVVAVSSGAARLLCYLEAADRLVGIESFDKKPLLGAGPTRWAYTPRLARLPFYRAPAGPPQINRDPDLEAVCVCARVIFIITWSRPRLTPSKKNYGIPVVILSYSKTGLGTMDEALLKSLRSPKDPRQEQRAEAVVGFIHREEPGRILLARGRNGIPQNQKTRVYVGGISLNGTQASNPRRGLSAPGLVSNARQPGR
jgi:iron complex transport system substrate-binding protein